MHFLGIDWADDKHDLCLLSDRGDILSQFSITHDWNGFQQLKSILDEIDDVQINIERRDGLLVDWLAGMGYPIFITMPTMLAHRRPRRSKDDLGDAYLLAKLLRFKDEECRPLIIQSPIVEHLHQLVNAYERICREQYRLSNQFIRLFKAYYPQALKLFSKPYRLIALAFYEAYPTPEAAAQLSIGDLEQFLRAHNYRFMSRLPAIYQALQTPAPKARQPAGHVEYMQLIIPLLRTLFHHRRHLKKRINAVFQTHPDANWWLSFPGIGPLTAARLLAYIGDNRERFSSSSILQAVAGTCPVTRRSGKLIAVEFRYACSHRLRGTMDDFARLSVKQSGWAKGYYQQQLALGHKKARAYRALANAWLRIIWKLWQTGEGYNETQHLANRARRGQPKLVPALAH